MGIVSFDTLKDYLKMEPFTLYLSVCRYLPSPPPLSFSHTHTHAHTATAEENPGGKQDFCWDFHTHTQFQ